LVFLNIFLAIPTEGRFLSLGRSQTFGKTLKYLSELYFFTASTGFSVLFLLQNFDVNVC